MISLCLLGAVVLGCARGEEGEATVRPIVQPGADGGTESGGSDGLGGAAGDPGEGTGGASDSGGTGGMPLGGSGGCNSDGKGRPRCDEGTGGTVATGGTAGTGGSVATGGATMGGTGGMPNCVPVPACTPATSTFTNPSFEMPTRTQTYTPDSMVPGWNSGSGSIELWVSGVSGIDSQAGGQHIEVEASAAPHTVSQQIASIPYSSLRWSFYHRSRDTTDDTLELWVGAPGNLTRQQTATTGATWTRYEGTYDVPMGQTMTVFEFRATVPGAGNGNHLDVADAELICPSDADMDGCLDDP